MKKTCMVYDNELCNRNYECMNELNMLINVNKNNLHFSENIIMKNKMKQQINN